jgi:hypothetical protein
VYSSKFSILGEGKRKEYEEKRGRKERGENSLSVTMEGGEGEMEAAHNGIVFLPSCPPPPTTPSSYFIFSLPSAGVEEGGGGTYSIHGSAGTACRSAPGYCTTFCPATR